MTEVAVLSDLTAQESLELEQYEAVIEHGVRAFYEMGVALAGIRDRRLYREQYRTFEDYCQERWGFARRTAYQYIEAAQVIENVRHGAHLLPENERQARPLTRLEPEQQVDAWSRIVTEHPDGYITGAIVQEAVDRLLPEYREFERCELLPYLHDAGILDAPQVLAGERAKISHISEAQRQQAKQSLREVVIEQLIACRTGQDVDESADNILNALGKTANSVSIAARFGIALAHGPQTLNGLTAIAADVSGECVDQLERVEYLRFRKRTLRILDVITYRGGLDVFEHRLENGQICYALTERQVA